jgi:MFS family permease
VEHAPPGRKAFYGSWPQAGVPAGLVLSSSAFFAVELLPAESVAEWGWRLPFLASVVLVALGLYIRLQVIESPEFAKVREARSVSSFPLRDLLRHARKPLLVGMFTQAAANVPFYVVTVFVLSYGPQELGVSRGVILTCLIVACVLDIFTIPWAAMLSDRFGKRNSLLAGSVYMGAIAFPFFWLFDTGSTPLILVAMILVVTVGHAVTYSAIAGFLAGLFQAEYRYTGASTAYQLGGMVTSGPAPFIAAALFAGAGGSWVISAYIAAACAVTFLALLAVPAKHTEEGKRIA